MQMFVYANQLCGSYSQRHPDKVETGKNHFEICITCISMSTKIYVSVLVMQSRENNLRTRYGITVHKVPTSGIVPEQPLVGTVPVTTTGTVPVTTLEKEI